MIWASRVSSARTGAITPLDDVVGHLLHCKRHPAAVLADEALAALAASLGKGGAEALLKLVEERNAQISGLRRLLDSCDRFDDDLGWNGDRAYARGYVEDALESSAGERERLPRGRGGAARVDCEVPRGQMGEAELPAQAAGAGCRAATAVRGTDSEPQPFAALALSPRWHET